MRYCSDLQDAIRQWDREVEIEAVRLIESGVPPYDAIKRAGDIVSQRRQGNPKYEDKNL